MPWSGVRQSVRHTPYCISKRNNNAAWKPHTPNAVPHGAVRRRNMPQHAARQKSNGTSPIVQVVKFEHDVGND